MVEVYYQHQEEDIPVSPNLNIFVAAFTTCHARLKLYEALEPLGERVLYYDTDSIIYLEEKPGQLKPDLGHYPGDFTSELGTDEYIEEFVSGGPKNYRLTPPTTDRLNVRSEGSDSTAKARPNSIMM